MAIVGQNVVKEFGVPATRVLHGLEFRIEDGEFIAITGRSGSGKSTLLYLISSLDDPTEGTITIDGKNVADMSVREVHEFRNREVGFIFQFHYLLPELTAIENVLLPARNQGRHGELRGEGLRLLQEFGIGDKGGRYPSQLSGGEQQRVAIARSLILRPRFIFADEPTGNLDTENSMTIMKTLQNVNGKRGTTIVLVTHEPDYAAMADREIYLIDGRVGVRAS